MKKAPTPSVLPWLLFVLYLFSGCATPTPPASIEKQLYRSDDYIIYRMKAGDTVESIAARFLGDSGKAWKIREANAVLRPGHYVVVPIALKNRGAYMKMAFSRSPFFATTVLRTTVPLPCAYRAPFSTGR